MTPREQGFLLLTSHLGDPGRKVLTTAQLRRLYERMQAAPKPDADRDLCPEDLMAVGYDRAMAHRIVGLLSQSQELSWYLRQSAQKGCAPLSRVSAGYPKKLLRCLGTEAPGCLWLKGDPELLNRPAVALVGSRDLYEENRAFAYEAGVQAARQGYTLVSGNARGADRISQESCLEHGGRVISIVADELWKQPQNDRVLYISLEGYDEAFSSWRALSRNRVIHSLADAVLVAQCRLGTGGTWSGSVQNLEKLWHPVYCFDDGSEAVQALCNRGAEVIKKEDLADLQSLAKKKTIFEL